MKMYILLSVVKILDNIVLTVKSLATYKGQKFLSSLLVIISQLFFYLIISQVINDNTVLSIVIVSVSSGIGNYVAFLLNDKFKKDDVWTNIITSNDKNFIVQICTLMKENHIKYLLYDTYNRKFHSSYTVTIFAKTKQQSRIIDDFLSNTNIKYLRMIDGVEVK